ASRTPNSFSSATTSRARNRNANHKQSPNGRCSSCSSLDVNTSVSFTFSSKKSSEADLDFLKLIASQISLLTISKDNDYIYVVGTSGLPPPDVPYNFILICASGDDYIQRAVAIISSKFVGRVDKVRSITPDAVIVEAREVGLSSYDELALWDAVRKSARAPIDPLVPPPGSRSAERMLSDARAHLQRLTPKRAFEELRDPVEDGVQAPTFLVDIRDERERYREGLIKGAVVVDRNELEWKFDPRAQKGERLGVVDRYDLRVIVFDGDGRASSLAAHQLRELGMWNATDIVGGFRAWKEDGFPVSERARSIISEQDRNGLLVGLDLVLRQ
ncbi:Rhodanese-like protein, partial [Marasmius fiardii PR-910]